MKAALRKTIAKWGIDVRRAAPCPKLIERSGAVIPMSLIEDVFAFFERVPYFYGADIPAPLKIAGAWAQDLRMRRQNQIRLIETRDLVGYRDLASLMFFDELIFGLWSYHYHRAQRHSSEFVIPSVRAFQDITGLGVEVLEARTPLTIWGTPVDGKLISYVSPAHAMQAWTVNNLLGSVPVVVDLGSGFGGMAEKLALLHNGPIDIWLLDIPANLTTAYLYLSMQFEDVKLLSTAEDIARIGPNQGKQRLLLAPTLLTPSVAEACPHIDVLHNSGSFSEMDRIAIDYYLETLVKGRARYLVETNSNSPALNAGHREIASSEFPIPATHRLIARYLPFDSAASGGRYLTSIYAHA